MKCSWSENQKTFGVIKAWNENGESDDDDFLVLRVRTVFDKNGLESKKILNIGMGWEMIVNMNISVDSVRPVKFIKENVFHELKIRYLKLKKNYPLEKKIRDLYCGFTDDTINILGKIIVRSQSNGWISEETPFFITDEHERNMLGKDHLQNLGIEVKQKKRLQAVCSVSQPPIESK